MPQPLRSVLAVIAGFVTMSVVVVLCTLLAVAITHQKSGHPTPGYLTLNVIYSLAAALLGGWVAGKLAGKSPVAHGIAMAIVMLVMSALSYMQYKGTQPIWYQVFLIIGPALAAIAGAALVRD